MNNYTVRSYRFANVITNIVTSRTNKTLIIVMDSNIKKKYNIE